MVETEGTSLVPHDTVFDELKAIANESQIENGDLAFAMAIYMLGFSSYDGFRSMLGPEMLARLQFNDRVSEYAKQLLGIDW